MKTITVKNIKRATALCTAAMLAILGACGSGTSSLGETPNITGQIQNWTQGTGYTMDATIPVVMSST